MITLTLEMTEDEAIAFKEYLTFGLFMLRPALANEAILRINTLLEPMRIEAELNQIREDIGANQREIDALQQKRMDALRRLEDLRRGELEEANNRASTLSG